MRTLVPARGSRIVANIDVLAARHR
jgi:hypothetical protein